MKTRPSFFNMPNSQQAELADASGRGRHRDRKFPVAAPRVGRERMGAGVRREFADEYIARPREPAASLPDLHRAAHEAKLCARSTER